MTEVSLLGRRTHEVVCFSRAVDRLVKSRFIIDHGDGVSIGDHVKRVSVQIMLQRIEETYCESKQCFVHIGVNTELIFLPP